MGEADSSAYKRVFLSSTKTDLERERAAVETALHQFHNTVFVGMEYFGSVPGLPKDVCLKKVAESDIYVGIFGNRYGHVDAASERSMTELEYREAMVHCLPCLIYLNDDSAMSPIQITDPTDDDSRKLALLKSDLKKNHVITFFRNPDHLATRVVIDVANILFQRRLPQKGASLLTTERRTLHAILATRFSLDELKTLCFNIRVDFENLSGEGRASKARSLIEYLERRREVPCLIEELRSMRPDIE